MDYSKLGRIEHVIHAVMVIFAVASLGNVAAFINTAHGNRLVAYSLGAALGAVLVVSAIMLTKIDRQHEPETFVTVAVIVAVSAALSGTVQFWAYRAHLSTSQAILLGYGVPIVGEACLAYAASLYTQAQRRAVIRSATDGTQERIAEIIAESLSDIDVTAVRGQVQATVRRIVAAQVAAVERTMTPTAPTVGGQNAATDKPDKPTNAEQNAAPIEQSGGKVAARRAAIAKMASGFGGDREAFIVECMTKFGVSRRTAARDIDGTPDIYANGTVGIQAKAE